MEEERSEMPEKIANAVFRKVRYYGMPPYATTYRIPLQLLTTICADAVAMPLMHGSILLSDCRLLLLFAVDPKHSKSSLVGHSLGVCDLSTIL